MMIAAIDPATGRIDDDDDGAFDLFLQKQKIVFEKPVCTRTQNAYGL